MCSDPFDNKVAEWLKRGGIQRIVVGHKPTGDCPAVLSALYTGVEIVSADTSFSDTAADDNRGKAMSVVEIAGASPLDNQLDVRGILRDGSVHESYFCRLHPEGVDVSVGDPNLGRQMEDGHWVKMVTTKESYWLSRGEGRNVEYRHAERSEIWQRFQEKTSA